MVEMITLIGLYNSGLLMGAAGLLAGFLVALAFILNI